MEIVLDEESKSQRSRELSDAQANLNIMSAENGFQTALGAGDIPKALDVLNELRDGVISCQEKQDTINIEYALSAIKACLNDAYGHGDYIFRVKLSRAYSPENCKLLKYRKAIYGEGTRSNTSWESDRLYAIDECTCLLVSWIRRVVDDKHNERNHRDPELQFLLHKSPEPLRLLVTKGKKGYAMPGTIYKVSIVGTEIVVETNNEKIPEYNGQMLVDALGQCLDLSQINKNVGIEIHPSQKAK